VLTLLMLLRLSDLFFPKFHFSIFTGCPVATVSLTTTCELAIFGAT